MKEHKPTIKDVKEILCKQVGGWNDKRSDYSRIKLAVQLSFDEQRKLHSELCRKFDAYKFTVGNIRKRANWQTASHIVGAITFWKKAEES